MQQFRLNGADYFAITNNNNNLNVSRWKSDKMIIYRIDNPDQVTCIFSQEKKDFECPTYMALLPSLNDKTIRIQKTQFETDHLSTSVVEFDTKSSEQVETNLIKLYNQGEL